MADIKQLYSDSARSKPIYPKTVGSAVELESGESLADLESSVEDLTASIVKLRSVTVTLTTAGWSSSAPYTQTVTVNGMTADWKPVHMTIPKTSTSVDTTTVLNELGALSCIQMCTSAAGKLTFTALETKPSVALTIEVHGGI